MSKKSFALETTLSGTQTVSAMRQASQLGFFVRVVYICLDDSERNVQRVVDRVSKGGHDVPEVDVRRRYDRSLANLATVIGFVDEVVVYDNSGEAHRKVLEFRRGTLTWQSDSSPT